MMLKIFKRVKKLPLLSKLVLLFSVVGLFFLITELVFLQFYKPNIVNNNLQKNNNLVDLVNASYKIDDVNASFGDLAEQKIATDSARDTYNKLLSAYRLKNYSEVERLSKLLEDERQKLIVDDINLAIEKSATYSGVLKKSVEYKKNGVDTKQIDSDLATGSGLLVNKEYSVLDSLISNINDKLDFGLKKKKETDAVAAEKARLAALVVQPVAPISNGGVSYERKNVNTARGAFSADILTVNLNSVKVKTFTANESDCVSNCPLKPLAQYVAENGGVAGINGSYFCPSDYSSCADVKNSFNTLLFDYRSKNYLNSDQNKYSVNPLMSFYGDGAHFYSQALGFGRDTSANGVISNHPALMQGGSVIVNEGSLDAKSRSTKSTRCGVGYRDKTLWAICARSATVGDLAYVYQSLGADNAMNLDGGGSSALYFGGYKVGPGRQLPNAIVFTN